MTHNINGVDTHQPDAFDDAMTDGPQFFAGQVAVDAYTCVLVKGQGKVPYNANTHQGMRTSTAITFNIAPLDPTRRMITREMVNWAAEFKGVVRPSIEALGDQIAAIKGGTVGEINSLREINSLFVTGEFVPKPDNKAGETFTTLSFTGVFATEKECQAVYDELVGEVSEVDETTDAPTDDTTQAERASLAAFLPAMWEAANHDVEKMAENLAANPMLAQHFDITSREVKELIDADPSQEIPV